VIRESPTGRPGLTLIFASADRPSFPEVATLDPETFETLRIEGGTPCFGRDITAANLPQEVDRNAVAISFVKGCYLGQETVARLDALGHVNKVLIGAIAENERVPSPGSILRADGKDVGVVTSSTFSPASSRGVVIGYVKSAQAGPGVELTAVGDRGSIALFVHPFPLLPPKAQGPETGP
jgi:folate-binding protein YgfZ